MMDKPTVLCTYNGMYYSALKKKEILTQMSLENTTLRKPGMKGQILQDSAYMRYMEYSPS